MKNTITIPAKTLTVGEIIDKHWHLLSKTSQERSVGAALAALNRAAQLAKNASST